MTAALPAEERTPLLRAAAKILYREASLECSEALELVGLPASCHCG